MIVSAMAMFAFPKQLRGNRIPSPRQVSTIETEKSIPRVLEEKEVKPNIRGVIFVYAFRLPVDLTAINN